MIDPRAASPSADALKGEAAAEEEGTDANEGLLEIAEGNVVSACSVFVASVVLDALNALPSTIVVDVPTALRTTALVLIALVAAPPVDPNLLFEQRGIASVCLFVTAIVGLHQGGVNARIADALYSLLCGWAVLLIFGVSGPKPGERGYDAKGKPAGGAWKEVGGPDVGGTDAFAIKVTGRDLAPVYRGGAVLIVSPGETPRRGDRVIFIAFNKS